MKRVVVEASERWNAPIDRWPINGLLHARLTKESARTLCEQGNKVFLGPDARFVLRLDHPDAEQFKDQVTCPECQAWLHA